MNFQIKKSRTFDICFPNKFFPKIKIRKCISLPNIKKFNIKNNFSYEAEEIGFMVDKSVENDNINNIKSFEITNNNKKKKTKKNILDVQDFEQCSISNSKHNLNKSVNHDKNNEIINNNKEYMIVPKLKNKDLTKRNQNSNIINNKLLLDINSDDNNDSKNLNILNNNYKTFEHSNNRELNRDIINTSQKLSFDEISIVSKINALDEREDNINIIEDDDSFLKVGDVENKKNINKYKLIIYKLSKEKIELEENISKAILTNNELKNYIEILKQTIENFIIKSGYKDIFDSISKDMNRNPISLLNEFTKYKLDNEKMKKNLLMQQIISTEMKEEIKNIKKENENLIKMNKKFKTEKEKFIINNTNNPNNANNDNISNNKINNENDYECLKNLSKINKELNENYLRLQNDFTLLSQNNEDIIKYNEKLIKENEKLKKEKIWMNAKNKNKENNDNNSNNNNNNNNDDNEMNDLINKINDLEKNHMELQKIIEKQKMEIDIKDKEIIQYNNDIENMKKKEYNNINEPINNNQELFNLKNQIKIIEQLINEIFEKQKKEEQKIFNKNISIFLSSNNIEDKIKNIKIFIEKLINQNEKNKNNKKRIFSELKQEQLINFLINNEQKEKTKENYYNSNSNLIHNSFEDFSLIKQKENQNNSNNELFFSNNNVFINKDIGEYNNMIDKLNNLLSARNKSFNIKNEDNNNNYNLLFKNGISPKTPSSNYINNIPKNNNSYINKSFSLKRTKKDNKCKNILNGKIEKINTEKIKAEFVISKKILNLEEEKINNNQRNIQEKSLTIKKKEENNNELNDLLYITMPYKFNKIENKLVSLKKSQNNSKINYSNNSSNMKNRKYSQGSQTRTIDSSSRMFTSNIALSNNEFSFINKNKEIKKKNNQVFALKKYKNIKNYLNSNKQNNENNKDKPNFADEVLKPTFLKSDVSTTLFNYYHSNPATNKNNKSKSSYENLYKNYL